MVNDELSSIKKDASEEEVVKKIKSIQNINNALNQKYTKINLCTEQNPQYSFRSMNRHERRKQKNKY